MVRLARDRLGGCMAVDSGETGQGYTRRCMAVDSGETGQE